MSLLQKVQEWGFPDWKSLATSIKKEVPPSTTYGNIHPSAIEAWLVYSFGIDQAGAKRVLDALLEMGFLTKTVQGNIQG